MVLNKRCSICHRGEGTYNYTGYDSGKALVVEVCLVGLPHPLTVEGRNYLCSECYAEYKNVPVPNHIPDEQRSIYRIKKVIKDRSLISQNENKGIV
jgi:hypothetical protein